MNRIAAFFLVCLFCACGLTACTQRAETSPAAEPAQSPAGTVGESSGEPATTGERIISIYGANDAWRDGFDEIAQGIRADHGIATDLVVLPLDQVESVISVKLATDDAPDLFFANVPQTVDQWNATETCVPLDNEPWGQRLAVPDLLRYRGDGKIYAMPASESSSFFGAMYYNKAVMAQCGITDPAPKTYQEFLDLLQTIKDAGVTPIHMVDKDSWCTQIWTTIGWGVAADARKDSIYDELNSGTLKFADVPEFVTILQQLQDLHTQGYTNEDHMSQTYDTAKVALGEGKAAMVLHGEGLVTEVKNLYPDVEIGSFAVPFADQQMIATGAYVVGFFVPKGGNSELAREYLNHWSQPGYQDPFFEKFPGFPAFEDVNGGEVLPAVGDIVQTFVDTGRYTYEFDSYFDFARPIMNDYLFGNIQEVAAGSKTPQEALADWDEKFAQYMKDKGVEGF